MPNNFTKYIKAVGTGKKHNHDLTQNEMCDAMNMILNQEIFPEQLSAFLLGWRLKPETTDEFKGVLDSFDNFIKRTKIENSIELGYPYDGKRNNPYLFSLIAKILKPYNINIVVTGDELQPTKKGITVKQIINKIDPIDNLHYFDRKDIFKELHNLTKTRMMLNIRTGLNSVERLINPASSDISFLGVFHKPFVEKYIDIFSNRYKKLVIVKGNEGTSEIYSKCAYWVSQNNQLDEYKIDPVNFGINYKKSWDNITLDESIEIINNPSDELINIAKLNAALILFSFDKFSSVENGYEELKSLIIF